MTNGKFPTNSKNGKIPTLIPNKGSISPEPTPPVKTGLFSRLKNYFTGNSVSMEEVLRRRTLIQLIGSAGIIFEGLVIIVAFFVPINIPNLPIQREGLITLMIIAIAIYIIILWLNRIYQVQLAGWLLVISVTLLVGIGNFIVWYNFYSSIFLSYFVLGIIVVLSGQVIDQIAPFVVASIGTIFTLISFTRRDFFSVPDNEVLNLIQIANVLLGVAAIYIFAALSWANARTTKNIFKRMEDQNHLLVEANQRLSQNFQSNITTANFIAGLSDQLSSLSVNQSSQTEQQVRAITKVSTTLSIVGDTARRLADASGEVFRTSEAALQTAEEGGRAIGESIDGIETLRQNVEHIAGIVYDLSQQSNRIGQIVELITELADETNLLALNATIEAAGAGEYGKRFAVVAQEVQTLANRSRLSARDVQTILSKITDAIKNTLSATEQGLEVAQQLSETAGLSGEAIEKIIAAIENNTSLSRQIYQATQVQSNVTEDAIKMINDVSQASLEAASRAAELARAGQQLSETSAKLKR
jgi:methyl-accepting chemotaxis protein